MKHVKLFEEFIDSELNEAKPGWSGAAIGTAIASTLVGVFVGIGASPVAGIAAGIATAAVIGGGSAISYFRALNKWKAKADMVLFEYGKADLDLSELEAIIEDFEKETVRIQKAKTEVIKIKQKIDSRGLEVDPTDIRVQKKNKLIKQIIEFEASELAAKEGFKVFKRDLYKLKSKYGETNFNRAFPGLGGIANSLMFNMERFGDTSGKRKQLGKAFKSTVEFERPRKNEFGEYDSSSISDLIDQSAKAVAASVADVQFHNVRDKMLKEYNSILHVYDSSYKQNYKNFLNGVKQKYKSEKMIQ